MASGQMFFKTNPNSTISKSRCLLYTSTSIVYYCILSYDLDKL